MAIVPFNFFSKLIVMAAVAADFFATLLNFFLFLLVNFDKKKIKTNTLPEDLNSSESKKSFT